MRPVVVLLFVLGCSQAVVEPREALMALFNATNGPHWRNNTGWGSASDTCTWFGVLCFAGNQDITELALSNNALHGTIPDALTSLSSLATLDVSTNSGLVGTLPASLGDLASLRQLLLFDTHLSGALPSSVAKLTALTDVFASRANFTAIPDALASLPSLQYVFLADNALVGRLPDLGALTGLLGFDVSRNAGLEGGLLPSMNNLRRLQAFRAANCSLSGTVPALSAASMRSLLVLDVSGNKFSGTLPPSTAGIVKDMLTDDDDPAAEGPRFNVACNRLDLGTTSVSAACDTLPPQACKLTPQNCSST